MIIFDDLSDTIYNSYETWPKGSLWGDLQNDVTLDDLDKKSRSHSLSLTLFVGNSIMKLEQKVACGPDLQNFVTLDYLYL